MCSTAHAHRPFGRASAPSARGGWQQFRLGLAGLVALLHGAVSAADTGMVATALQPKSSARGATLFAEVPAEVSGIKTQNAYADPAMWGRLNQEFSASSIGTGVAIGDYDGDGRPDIFVVSKTESCRLFRNLGDWKFADVTEQAGVADLGDAAKIWKQGAAFADVNNDGRPDLYVCRTSAPNLLYLNQGDGTFKEQAKAAGLDLTDSSVMAAFCDYDRDGWLDVYVSTNLLDATAHPSGQRGVLYHNRGDGTFANVSDRAGIAGEAQSHSATWWDFDEDGWPDLYVANDFAALDKLYRNNHDGTFTDVIGQVVPHTPFSSMGADLGDLDNDGHVDLMVADMAATSREKDQRGMVNSRSLTKEPPDGSPLPPQYIRNALFANTGTGRCLETAFLAGLAATDWTWSVRFEDLDNDGRLDLHVTNGMDREATNLDLLARQRRAESAAERIQVMHNSPVLAEANLAYRNLGDWQFEDVSKAWGLGQKGVSFGAAFGDLDGDGDLDLVYTNYRAGVTVLRNDCDTGHQIVIELRGTTSNRFGVGASVRVKTESGTQVRDLVLARGYLSTSEPTLHFGLGADREVQQLTVTWPSGRVQTFTHLAADQRFTLTEPAEANAAIPRAPVAARATEYTESSESRGLTAIAREELIDETALQPLLATRLNRRGPALALGTIDAQAGEQLAVGGTTRDPWRLFSLDAQGNFSPVNAAGPTAPSPTNDGPILVFDANGDGANDLLVTKAGNTATAGSPEYDSELWLNDGHGHLRAAPKEIVPSLGVSVGAAAAADFDHDGQLDLFLGGRVLTGQYPFPPRSGLFHQHAGRLMDMTDTVAPGLREVGQVTSALWSDVDGDGWVDLLLTLDWGTVKYFHNEGGRALSDQSEPAGFAAAGSGWWTSLASADFNGDGRPDYAVGNVGLNTQYRADATHPALLFAGDFVGNGESTQLVEATYEGERLLPWRSRKDLNSAVPTLLKRWPRNDYFARASLGEILGEEKLAQATRFAATELRSGVFLSQPDGTYRFTALPRLAQVAPLQGMVAGDLDGDGNADLFAAQNSFAPIAAVGRFNGGLGQLLRGDGRGGFVAVPATESGLVVPGDAKAVVRVDLDHDGWPELVVSRNQAPPLVFHRTPVANRHFVAVTLRGKHGNPAAIGSRVSLVSADGDAQVTEIFAGSSFSSQSAATAFLAWTKDHPPRAIRVRWPNGTTSEFAFAGTATRVTLDEP